VRLFPSAKERGFQYPGIAKTGSPAMENQQPIMKGEHVPFVDPDRLPHLARTCSVFR